MEYSRPLTSDEYDKLINDLIEWCEPRGRRVELAEELGLSRQHITNILAKRKMLSFEQAIAIKKIIRRKR
jgi:plasmid maintenance system antidote protein VapI